MSIFEYKIENVKFGADNLPPEPPSGIMWVFYEGNEVWAVNFMCPCGCGSQTYTPIRKRKHGPAWNFKEDKDGPTITPSIRFIGGCKAHFNITNGKTVFHGDSGQ